MMNSLFKKLFLIISICYVEYILAPGLIKFNIVLPLTFLAYSFYMYRSKNKMRIEIESKPHLKIFVHTI